MSKKHFIELADVLKARLAQIDTDYSRSVLYQTVAIREHEETIKALADFCQAQNGNFNRGRWLAYIAGECGPSGGTRKGAK